MGPYSSLQQTTPPKKKKKKKKLLCQCYKQAVRISQHLHIMVTSLPSSKTQPAKKALLFIEPKNQNGGKFSR